MSGKAGLSDDTLILYVYGQYLLNGGRHDDFLDLTMDDVQIMASVLLGTQKRTAMITANTVGRTLFRSDGND